MKKSNIFLLGGFLTVVVLISAIHITLYAKYKAGDYTIYNAEDDLVHQSMQSFPNILFVSVQNVQGATVRFGEVAQTKKRAGNDVQFIHKGDTLLIIGKHIADEDDFRQPLSFSLPYNATLSVLNSSLVIETGKKIAENNPAFYMQKSQVLFSGMERPFQLGHVKLVASDSSAATFQGNTQINQLEVQLSNSTIESMDGNFGQLSISTDSVSRISLQARHLSKATIKTVAPQ